MICYPLSTLMLAGVRDVLVVTAPDEVSRFRRLLGDGSRLGLRLEYAVQERPDGPAQALLIGADFVAGHPVALALADTVIHGDDLAAALSRCTDPSGAHVFAYRVMDPSSYGVVEFDATGHVVSIEEKPARPRSDFAVPGLYFYAADVVDVARAVRPGPRGRLEVTAVHEEYRRQGRLTATTLHRGIAWLDTGTVDTLRSADEYVRMIEARDGRRVGCVEEVAWRRGWIGDDDLLTLAATGPVDQRDYLNRLVAYRRADAAVITLPDQRRPTRALQS
jgi:glucose-1-phosphate thymidylyltransferase